MVIFNHKKKKWWITIEKILVNRDDSHDRMFITYEFAMVSSLQSLRSPIEIDDVNLDVPSYKPPLFLDFPRNVSHVFPVSLRISPEKHQTKGRGLLQMLYSTGI